MNEVSEMDKQQLFDIDVAVRSWFSTLNVTIPRLIEHMETDTKQNRFDLVTNVDRDIQQNFEQFLQHFYPSHQLLAEEKSNQQIDAYHGHVWVMDPIDGTMNLVKQQTDYCVILAYFVDSEPMLSYIYDYPNGILYKAIKGEGAYANDQPLKPPHTMDIKDAILSFNAQVLNLETVKALFDASFSYRIIGSCGLDSMRVIKGQFGAHVNTNPKPWDIGAQFLFASELGLKMTTLNNESVDFAEGGPFIISNKACHQQVLDILNDGNGYQK